MEMKKYTFTKNSHMLLWYAVLRKPEIHKKQKFFLQKGKGKAKDIRHLCYIDA